MQINWPAAGLTVLPSVGGFLNAYQTRKEVKGWYKTLQRPTWTPPDYAFAPIWTSLYTGMGYASYLVYRDGGGIEGAKLPLALYGSQLLLNWAWTPIFFGRHNVSLALIEIIALWANAAACGVAFYGVNKTAGYIFIPYLAWLSIATALNYRIYKDNPVQNKVVGEISNKIE